MDFHETFEGIQARIRSMAVAHEILYQSDNFAHLCASEYVGNLSHFLYSHRSTGSRVEMLKKIEDVSFGLDTAIPLGFLLTELVTNCLTHAFPDGRAGRVNISLHRTNEHEFDLIVSDNGAGIPDSIDWRNPRPMGFDLIDTFAEQLRAQVQVNRTSGTEVRVRFKEI